MELYPAIDLRDGQAVRLEQGDFDRQRGYGDPLELSARYQRAGARWIHVVDLDAARTGTASNRDVVLSIARSGPARVQAGGGVRSAADAEELLGGGVSRVVLGTAAVNDPDLVVELAARFPGQVAVGIDHRREGAEVAISGWERGGGISLADALVRFEAVALGAVVVTSIERDGVSGGPDLSGLGRVLESTPHPVVASGGVRSADDLRALAGLESSGRRLHGAIVGRALVDGSLDIEEAIAVCAPCE